jgi:hypothetical protein
VAPAAARLCGAAADANWIAPFVAVSARAAVSGPASIVAPSSAAIATERATGADIAIGWVKDDMAVSFLDFNNERCYRHFVVCGDQGKMRMKTTSVSPRKILIGDV